MLYIHHELGCGQVYLEYTRIHFDSILIIRNNNNSLFPKNESEPSLLFFKIYRGFILIFFQKLAGNSER